MTANSIFHSLLLGKNYVNTINAPLGGLQNIIKCGALLQYGHTPNCIEEDRQIFSSFSGNIRGNNAQTDSKSPKRATNTQESDRPGHDIEDLIVFPGCLEGENCHDSNCTYDILTTTIVFLK